MPARRTRDPRLDFFRGLAMLIIFVAHVRENSWSQHIPVRFGFSSAAEMFVFCSGCASAFAFESVFAERGWRLGTVRILYRIWQLYWAHIGLFLVLATFSITGARLHFGTRDYLADLSLGGFASDGLGTIARLLTLTYVPDLLNILPMYVVLLALVPLAMALSRISPLLVVPASAALWGLVQATGLNLPAGGAPGRTWFFDPFAWQLMFFTGFAVGMGWLPNPRLNHPALLPIATAIVVASVPINFWAFTNNVPGLLSIHNWLIPDGIAATTRLDALRYTHFLCLAYVVVSYVDRHPKAIVSPALAPVVAIGRQALPAFVASVIVAWSAGILLDILGRDFLPVAAVNLFGFAVLFGIARCAAWLKSAPCSTRVKQAGRNTPQCSDIGMRMAAYGVNARPNSPPQPADA